MLKENDIVTIGKKKYKVTRTKGLSSCMECDIKNCQSNKGYDELKAKMFALSCIDLIPLHTCFKEIHVELSQQVGYKY